MRNVVIQSVLAICNPKDESVPPEHLPDVLLVDLRTTTAGDADYTALVAAVKSGFGATTPTSPTTYVNFGQFATNFPRNTASFFLDPTSWCRLQLDVTSFKKFIPPTRASSAPNDGPAECILTRYNERRHDARRTLLKGSGEAAEPVLGTTYVGSASNIRIRGRLGRLVSARKPPCAGIRGQQRTCGGSSKGGERISGEDGPIWRLIVGRLLGGTTGVPEFPLRVSCIAGLNCVRPPTPLTRERQAVASAETKLRYDTRTRLLSPIPIGTQVRIQDLDSKLWTHVGVIMAVNRYRYYQIKFASGSVLWRNRRLLRPMVSAKEETRAVDDPPADGTRHKERDAIVTPVPARQHSVNPSPDGPSRRTRVRKPKIIVSV
ncbi:hypothetical protein OUZ56_012101 [Daphnia magna]|uniref:Uncharacterized protein n=1 Tax=Daphnia magna TaxID=35525 RepID=A0ABQ9Z220_9CRUS|nr:hypothetical protein OUZ56_012101 [Daphnia magna]